jgi:hypothetical protein
MPGPALHAPGLADRKVAQSREARHQTLVLEQPHGLRTGLGLCPYCVRRALMDGTGRPAGNVPSAICDRSSAARRT